MKKLINKKGLIEAIKQAEKIIVGDTCEVNPKLPSAARITNASLRLMGWRTWVIADVKTLYITEHAAEKMGL